MGAVEEEGMDFGKALAHLGYRLIPLGNTCP
jgi:hypothetical protein